MTKPVRPRPAASLVACRGQGSRRSVLMGRRPTTARFAPDMWVFPGGGLEVGDGAVAVASPLDAGIAPTLKLSATAARALAVAAVRETYEETGLMLGHAGDPGVVPGAAWDAFRAVGLAPDLAGLRALARAITPTQSPIRFHARFLMVQDGHFTGSLVGSGELLDLAWVPLAEARRLNIMDVTDAVLDLVERGAPPAFMSYRGRTLVAR